MEEGWSGGGTLYEYGGIPPVTTTLIDPVEESLHNRSVVEGLAINEPELSVKTNRNKMKMRNKRVAKKKEKKKEKKRVEKEEEKERSTTNNNIKNTLQSNSNRLRKGAFVRILSGDLISTFKGIIRLNQQKIN